MELQVFHVVVLDLKNSKLDCMHFLYDDAKLNVDESTYGFGDSG